MAVGAGATGWLTRLVASQRYGVTPVGPVVLGAVSIAMLGLAATSAALAAKRIVSIAPAEVLRQT